jgi:hypothetical protein
MTNKRNRIPILPPPLDFEPIEMLPQVAISLRSTLSDAHDHLDVINEGLRRPGIFNDELLEDFGDGQLNVVAIAKRMLEQVALWKKEPLLSTAERTALNILEKNAKELQLTVAEIIAGIDNMREQLRRKKR